MRSPFAGQTVLVLGASGFIGRMLVDALSQTGAQVIGVVRTTDHRRIESTAVEFVTADLLDAAALSRVLTQSAAALVINAAGYGVDRTEQDDGLLWALNAELPRRLTTLLAEMPPAARWRGVRLLQLGTGAELGEVRTPCDESVVPAPTSLYGRSKAAGTAAVLQSRVSARVARLFNVYGPGEHPGRLLPSLVAARAHALPIRLTAGTQRRDFAFVGDVVDAALALAALPATENEVVHVASGVLQSVRAFVETAAAVLDLDPARLEFGAIETRGLETSYTTVSVDRLRARIGWHPSPDVATGVRRTLAWPTSMRPDRPPRD